MCVGLVIGVVGLDAALEYVCEGEGGWIWGGGVGRQVVWGVEGGVLVSLGR